MEPMGSCSTVYGVDTSASAALQSTRRMTETHGAMVEYTPAQEPRSQTSTASCYSYCHYHHYHCFLEVNKQEQSHANILPHCEMVKHVCAYVC